MALSGLLKTIIYLGKRILSYILWKLGNMESAGCRTRKKDYEMLEH